MRFRGLLLFCLGALCTAVVGSGVSYAADGGTFLIGRSNRGATITTLSNPVGGALSLISKRGVPSLRVSDTTKVAHLNADLLDGVDSASFARASGRTGVVFGAADDADGRANTAQCPAGAIATGGGGYAAGTRNALYYSGPDFGADGKVIANSWLAMADGATYAWVVCYNPRGSVTGAALSVPPAWHKAA